MNKLTLFSVLFSVLLIATKAQAEPLFLLCNGLEQSFVDGKKSSETKAQRTVEIKQNQENVWGVVVDNLREITKSKGIDVKDNEIYAFQDSDTNDKDTYVLSTNRISGKFTETLRTKYTGSHVMRRVLSGECTKVDRKI